MRPRSALILALSSLAVIALTSCKDRDKNASTEALALIPAELHGLYGRTTKDAPGMRVSESGLEFGEMKLIIHEGKMEGDTVRIERATMQWEKLEPRTCTGTLSRQGDQLLMSLYEVGGAQESCEKLLDAEWFHWQQIDELPAMLQGRYGQVSVEPKGLRLEFDWSDERMTTESIYELPGSNDERVELLVLDAKVSYQNAAGATVHDQCSGTIKLADGQLSTKFEVPKRLIPEPGSDAAKDPKLQAKLADNEDTCRGWAGRAYKWEVSMEKLPKAPLVKGEVSLAIDAEKVVLASPALRCEQALWRTESIESGRGRLGGERMTLSKAEPSAVSDDCKLNIRIFCERRGGANVADLDLELAPSESVSECMQESERELCPASITVQAISDVRYKFKVEPPSFHQIACVDMTGDFMVKN